MDGSIYNGCNNNVVAERGKIMSEICNCVDKVKGKPKGLVRKIDSLGRLVIPKPFLKSLNAEDCQAFEIFLYDNGIFIQKVK